MTMTNVEQIAREMFERFLRDFDNIDEVAFFALQEEVTADLTTHAAEARRTIAEQVTAELPEIIRMSGRLTYADAWPFINAAIQRLIKERVTTPMQKPITFTYTNHQNETRERTVRPISLEWLRDPGRGHSPGWFLRAFDLEKREQRSFALTHIHTPGTPPLSSFTLLFFEDTI